MTPTATVQGQLDAYNAQDLDAYMAFFADDCVIADLDGAVTMQGAAAIRSRYAQVFAQYPENRAELLHRITIGSTVIDHEDVARTAGGERFQVAAIYAVRDGKIARVDFVRG
jgi:uncharacterized protein (TIGR02246 family)